MRVIGMDVHRSFAQVAILEDGEIKRQLRSASGGGASARCVATACSTSRVPARAPRTIADAKVEEVVTRTLESQPAGDTHWSTRGMARAAGISHASVQRIWAAFGLQPHRSETFKLSADPLFIDKVRDIAGLYLNPPDRALVLCVDEKSQIQALDRTQPLKRRNSAARWR